MQNREAIAIVKGMQNKEAIAIVQGMYAVGSGAGGQLDERVREALLTHLRVERLSSCTLAASAMLAMRKVLELPPSEFLSRNVSFESR
jgi:hypothetical protein